MLNAPLTVGGAFIFVDCKLAIVDLVDNLERRCYNSYINNRKGYEIK